MKKIFLLVSVTLLAFMIGTNTASAAVSGPDVIPAPASVIDDVPGAENMHQQAFNEMQDVVLAGDIACDADSVVAGTRVNSHMIFYNTEGGQTTTDTDKEWTFDGDILCVMSDRNGTLEAATNAELGALGTTYPGAYDARGLEGAPDGYTISGDKITVTMRVSEPGDWIRVVTLAPEPEPQGPSHAMVMNYNGAIVGNKVVAGSDTGGNRAGGSEAGDGGRGGDIRNSGDDVDNSTTGNGGRGGSSSNGGYIMSGTASADAGAINLVNSNTTRINRCACDDAQEGHVLVVSSNRAGIGNLVLAGAETGNNDARGSYAGDGGRGGDINNSDEGGQVVLLSENHHPSRGDDVNDSNTGNGGIGGNSGVGGTVLSGPALSRAIAFNAVNSNDTRILR